MSRTHLLVGAGKMGGALLSGWLESGEITPRNLVILDPDPGTQAVYAIERGAKHLGAAEDMPKSVRTVLLGIKPQMFARVGEILSPVLHAEALIVSILAGTNLARLRQVFAPRPVIRAMPNTPAAIGAGISAIYADPDMSETDLDRAEALLRAGGKVVRVDSEAALDAVTAVSGSGPAYVFHMVETLAAAGRKIGLPAEIADELARETIIGAGQLMRESEDTPTTLRKNVTSPNGTTQAALEVLMAEGGLSPLMEATVKAAFTRAQELSAE